MTIAMDLEEDSPGFRFTATCDTPESRLIECSDITAVRRAIEQLPIVFREVVLLRDVEDASYREIADILSIPIGTVMSRLYRARKILRDSLHSAYGVLPSKDFSDRSNWHENRAEACREIKQ